MRIINGILQVVKNVVYEVVARLSRISNRVNHSISYVCQFAKPEHAELSLKKELDPLNDPYWAETGASSPKRYAAWAFTMCGMASTAMALSYFHHKNIKPALLAEDALLHGVYTESEKELSAMKYREFAKWIKKYNLYANVYTKLSTKGIRYALSKGRLVIISVNPNIRGYNTAPVDQKGGHLVLVTGYDLDNKTIRINNPSGFVNNNTQVNHELTEKEFLSYYAGRGIVIEKLI